MNDYRVKGQVTPDMSEPAFLRALREGGSPVGSQEAQAVYRYCLARQVSPAWLLAVFRHESSFGTAGTATQTHSWGNTREPSFGVPSLGTVAGRSGTFSRYANWADGGVSTVARVCDHAPYAAARTVREITPIWAPSADGNNVEGYIAAVLADIERWARPAPSPGLAVREAIVPAGNGNRPGLPMTPRYITVHETSNAAIGANAEMHRRFVWGGGGAEGVSFHWVVDDTEAIHLIPDNEVAWHAGDGYDGPGNRASVAIETCVNADGDWARTRRNLALLVASLMRRHGIPLTDVVQHNRWSGKDCPLVIRRDGLWAGTLAAVAVAYEAQGPAAGPLDAYRDTAIYRLFATLQEAR